MTSSSRPSAPDLPARSARHGLFGVASFLLFQLIIMVFGLLVLLASGNLAPGWLGAGPAAMNKAIHMGVWITLPIAAVGVVLGFIDYFQLTCRRLFGTLGLLLNGLHALLCLLLLRG